MGAMVVYPLCSCVDIVNGSNDVNTVVYSLCTCADVVDGSNDVNTVVYPLCTNRVIE